MNVFVDSLYDAVVDSLKVLPILFLAYLLVSFLSHDHSHKFSNFISKNKKFSVFYASVLGCVPQCGFSSVVADLYSERHVSLGTLVAVFVATSDEAIPIMLSNTKSIVPMLELIGIKLAFAILWGYVIDLAVGRFLNKRKAPEHIEDDHAHHHSHQCGHIHCEHCDKDCGHEHGNCCGDNILADAFGHTFTIFVYILVATFAINMIVGYVGTDALANILTGNKYVQVVLAGLIGLIPNCASSVLLVELFMFGTLSFPALVAGLTAGAGVGLVVLFARNKHNMLENCGIVGLQYVIGVTSGLVLALIL